MRALLAALLVGCQAIAAPVNEAPRDRVVLTGSIVPSAAAEITVPVTDESPLVLRWIAADGTVVKAGDRIAELDAAPFLERLRTGRAELASAEAQFRLAQRAAANQLADKRFAVRRGEIEHQKAELRASVPAELLSARTAKQNQAQLRQAADDLRAARADLALTTKSLALEAQATRIDLDTRRASIQVAADTLPRLVMVAPRDGVVAIALNVYEGRAVRIDDSVDQGQLLATLPDLARPMEVHADLSDVDDGRVKVGETATCTLDAYPDEPIACTVVAIAPIARAPSRDSLRRAFDVRLALAPQPRVALRPNLSVKVAFGGDALVERPAAVTSVDVVGDLAAASTLDIKTPRLRDLNSFTIAWLAPDAGDVAAGAPIIRFDDIELGKSIDTAKADLAELAHRTDRRRAETVVARRAEALRILEAEAGVKRAALKHLPRDLVSAIDLRSQELDAELAQIELEQAQRAAAFAKQSDAVDLHDYEAASAATAQRIAELEQNRTRLTIAAPKAGTFLYASVGADKRKVGDGMYQDGTVGYIVSLDTMVGLGAVDEVDLGRLRAGARVKLRLDALPDVELHGTLATITSEVQTRDTDPSKVVRVKLAIEGGGALLRPGMHFHGTIEVQP